MRLEGLHQLKIPMTSLGIKPETFRPVAQCLNQLRHRPSLEIVLSKIFGTVFPVGAFELPRVKRPKISFITDLISKA
jgi:hypothetical protein